MAAPKRTPIQIEHDRVEIARRYLHGETQAAIGRVLGMTQQMVCYDLKAIQAQWRRAAIRDFDEAKGQELAKIDELERTYWEAWAQSKEEKQTKSAAKEQGEGKNGTVKTKTGLRTEGRDGNPVFLAGVMACIDRRCKLLGVDAPVKLAPTDPSGLAEYGMRDYRAEMERRLSRIAAANSTSGLPG